MKKGLWYYNTVALTPMGYPIGLITGWIGPWVLRGTFHGASHGIPRDVTDAIELPMRCSTRQPIYTMFPVKEVPRGVLWDVQWDISMAWPRGIPMRQHGIFHGLLGHPMGNLTGHSSSWCCDGWLSLATIFVCRCVSCPGGRPLAFAIIQSIVVHRTLPKAMSK